MCRLGSYPRALCTSKLIHHPAERYLLSRSARANTLVASSAWSLVRMSGRSRRPGRHRSKNIRILDGRPRASPHSCRCPAPPSARMMRVRLGMRSHSVPRARSDLSRPPCDLIPPTAPSAASSVMAPMKTSPSMISRHRPHPWASHIQCSTRRSGDALPPDLREISGGATMHRHQAYASQLGSFLTKLCQTPDLPVLPLTNFEG